MLGGTLSNKGVCICEMPGLEMCPGAQAVSPQGILAFVYISKENRSVILVDCQQPIMVTVSPSGVHAILAQRVELCNAFLNWKNLVHMHCLIL